MSKNDDDVVIVGGGIIAMASAYYLSLAGHQVRVIDRGNFQNNCSHGNCGFVCPSHILPLCEPGALLKTLKGMFRKDSPLYVNPFVGPALWAWLLRFSQRCRFDLMMEAAQARHALLESSLALYKGLVDEGKIDCEWKKKGLLFVFQSKEAMNAYAKTNDLIEDQFKLGAKRYDNDDLLALESALKPGLAGGWLHEHDNHLNPQALMASWRETCTAMGTQFIENCELKSFTIENGTVVAAETTKGSIPTRKVLLTTGAESPLYAKQLGWHLHIQPGKGYSITTNRPDPCPTTPMIFVEHKVAVTPLDNAYRLGSMMEFNGYDKNIHPKRIGLLEKGATHYLQTPRGDTIHEKWCGWRPMTHNGIPNIGQSPKIPNAYIATGHSMLGVSMAPGTGKLISEIISGDKPHLDASAFA